MVGTILGIMGNAAASIINNRLAGQQAEKDRASNYRYNELAAQNADARTRALYNDFYSPEALLKQYKNAGLSPSLMFGGTPGQGGMSGAQGNGANGLQTPYMPMSMLEAAQVANIEAQTKKTQAETDTIEGKNERGATEIAEGQSRIKTNLSQAGLNDAAANLTKAQEIGQKIINETSYSKCIAEINYMQQLTSEALWRTFNQKIDYEFNLDTYNKRVEILNQTYTDLFTSTLLKNSEIKLNNAQIGLINQKVSESISQVAQGWRSLELQKIDINNRKEIALKNLNKEYTLLSQDWLKFTRSLAQEKELTEKGIKQRYWGMGTDVFNNTVRTAGNMFGMYYLMGGKNKTSILGPDSNGEWYSPNKPTPNNVPGSNLIYFY